MELITAKELKEISDQHVSRKYDTEENKETARRWWNYKLLFIANEGYSQAIIRATSKYGKYPLMAEDGDVLIVPSASFEFELRNKCGLSFNINSMLLDDTLDKNYQWYDIRVSWLWK